MTSPALVAIAKALYGDTVEPAEFAKSIDAADVHIDGPLLAAPKRRRRGRVNTDLQPPVQVKAAQVLVTPAPIQKFAPDEERRGRKAAAIGLGASGVASVAGIHALTATRGENAARRAALAGEPHPPKAPGRIATKLVGKVGPKKAAAIIGGGLLGLHGVELVGDALAVHTQANQLRKPRPKPVSKGMVRLSVKPVNPTAVRRVVSLRAKRPAASPAPMAKGVRGVIHTGRNVRAIAEHAKGTAKNADEITAKVSRLIPKPKTAAYALGGVTAAGIAGRGVATYEGTKHGVQRGMRKMIDARVPISKTDDERMQVFGWANVSVKDGRLVVDRQGDIIEIGELEKMAYDYVQDSRVGADQHRRIAKDFAFTTDLGPRQTATMIESMVFTPEKIEKMGLPADFPQGWWVGMQIQDQDVWADIKSGKRTGFSIHGMGRRTPIPGELVGVGKALDLRERTRQAIHPPPVKRTPVNSQAMRSIGYQPQTRKLAIQMRSREEPYNYRVDRQTADAVLTAPSKGRAYHEHIRNKAPHHTRYRVSDRARLFAHPDKAST